MSEQKRMGRDLTVGSVPKLLIAFASPLFLSNLLQAVYNMVDMIVVGKYVGSAGLSAVAIGGDILHFLTFIAMGFANAGQVIISQYTGAGRKDKINRLIGNMFTFLTICAILMTVFGIILREPIMDALNTPDESRDGVRSYITVCMLGLVFIYGYNMVSAVLRGMGDSRHPFMFIAAAAVLNLVLDIVFVGFMDMGAFGAALATVIGQSLSFVCSLVLLYRKREVFGFDFKPASFALSKNVLSPLVSLGIPMAIQSAAINFSKMFVSSWINSYGVMVSAVAGIGNKLGTIANLFGNSFTTAAGAMVGQNIGAAKYERVPKIISATFIVNVSVATVLSAAVYFFPEAVFGIFTSEEAVMAVAMEYIPIALLTFYSMSFRSCMSALINGSGNSRLNLCVAIFDGVIARIGLSYLIGQIMGFGYMGFWTGSELAGFVPFVVGGVYFLSGRWKRKSKLIED